MPMMWIFGLVFSVSLATNIVGGILFWSASWFLNHKDPQKGLTTLLGGVEAIRHTSWFIDSKGTFHLIEAWRIHDYMLVCSHPEEERAHLPDNAQSKVCSVCSICGAKFDHDGKGL
jgi:hypothetical protein